MLTNKIFLFYTYRFFADILLTPLEATRIRLVSERGFATGLVSGFMRIAKEGGLRELYAGFLPILCKYVFTPLLQSPRSPQNLLQFIFSDKYPTQLVNSLSMNSATNLYSALSLKKLNAKYPKIVPCDMGFNWAVES